MRFCGVLAKEGEAGSRKVVSGWYTPDFYHKRRELDAIIQDLYNISTDRKEHIMATKTLNIALDETLLQQIDAAVKKDLGSRSEYFRRLALDDLERRREWEELFDAGNKMGREMGITSEEQVYQILDEYKREKRQKQAENRS